jgi:predicted RNase H-like HicB family nuclease
LLQSGMNLCWVTGRWPRRRYNRDMVIGKSRAGYIVVLEKARNNWSAYAPDVPGCITTGRDPDKTMRHMEEALRGHIRLMRADGDRIQRPRSEAELRRRRLLLRTRIDGATSA